MSTGLCTNSDKDCSVLGWCCSFCRFILGVVNGLQFNQKKPAFAIRFHVYKRMN